MSTERPGSGDNGERSASRFAYHGDDLALEGGVQAVGKRPGAGAPGPEERLLDISELARTVGMRYTHHFHIPPRAEDDLDLAAPLDGALTLTNTGGLLLLRGNVETTLRLECARCLAPVAQEVAADLEEEFDLVTARNAFHQEEVQAVDEDSPASVIQGNVLNLGELLRQNLLLAAPLQPLCREDCPGLDLSGRVRSADAAPEADAGTRGDNPLRHLAQLLEEKRRVENEKG